MYVNTFFVRLFFLAKDGVPQSVSVQECFVYMYLQTDIHKHLQTLVCFLWKVHNHPFL